MLGIIIGDIIGSIYEFSNYTDNDTLSLMTKANEYTDDTIIALATSKTILENEYPDSIQFAKNLWIMGRKYPTSYGALFSKWLMSNPPKPYNSYGNGALVRILAVINTELILGRINFNEVYRLCVANLRCTHNNQLCYDAARALCEDILNSVINQKANLKQSTILFRNEIHPSDETTSSTLQICTQIFPQAKSFEDLMIRCIKYGGDTDTICAICGGIWEALYGTKEIHSFIKKYKIDLRTILNDEDLFNILHLLYYRRDMQW